MKEINTLDIFNDRNLNIFTDASIIKQSYGFDGCSGCIAVTTNGNKIDIDSNLAIRKDTTNNESEIAAIQFGIAYACKFKQLFPNIHINLFSDSKISVMGLKEWIYSWIKNSRNGILISSSGQAVKNQNVFLDCIDMIIKNNLDISIYHINGHVKNNDKQELYKALMSFREVNNLTNYYIDMELFKKLCCCNDIIDNISRDILSGKEISVELNEMSKIAFADYVINSTNYTLLDDYISKAFIPTYDSLDIDLYKKLLLKED